MQKLDANSSNTVVILKFLMPQVLTERGIALTVALVAIEMVGVCLLLPIILPFKMALVVGFAALSFVLLLLIRRHFLHIKLSTDTLLFLADRKDLDPRTASILMNILVQLRNQTKEEGERRKLSEAIIALVNKKDIDLHLGLSELVSILFELMMDIQDIEGKRNLAQIVIRIAYLDVKEYEHLNGQIMKSLCDIMRHIEDQAVQLEFIEAMSVVAQRVELDCSYFQESLNSTLSHAANDEVSLKFAEVVLVLWKRKNLNYRWLGFSLAYAIDHMRDEESRLMLINAVLTLDRNVNAERREALLIPILSALRVVKDQTLRFGLADVFLSLIPDEDRGGHYLELFDRCRFNENEEELWLTPRLSEAFPEWVGRVHLTTDFARESLERFLVLGTRAEFMYARVDERERNPDVRMKIFARAILAFVRREDLDDNVYRMLYFDLPFSMASSPTLEIREILTEAFLPVINRAISTHHVSIAMRIALNHAIDNVTDESLLARLNAVRNIIGGNVFEPNDPLAVIRADGA